MAGIGLASRRFPFAIIGIDTDNGSEFINYHLKTFCEQGGIELTRSRPWVKNDGCRVEQKNGALVRKHAGYRRLEANELCDLKELYAVLGLLVNFFEPSAKLVRKITLDGKTRKHYDTAKTPYRRALESEHLGPEAKAKLTAKFLTLNPVSLRNRLVQVKKNLLEPDLVRFLDDSTTHFGAILT